MPACEKCWTEANRRMLTQGGSVADHYEAVLEEMLLQADKCTPREQAGQWWDEERQRDRREPTGASLDSMAADMIESLWARLVAAEREADRLDNIILDANKARVSE